MATVRTLQLHTKGKIAICSDSEYLLRGACGAPKRWRVKGWVGSCGPVSNVRIWKDLLLKLDTNERELVCIKVPSHVTMEGNNEADRLASFGLHSHPLYPFNPTPHKETAQFCTPSPPFNVSESNHTIPFVMDVCKQIDFF